MKTNNLSVKEIVNNKKNEELTQNEKVATQYYILDEQHDIVLGEDDFNEGIDKVMESSEKKRPKGEVLLINERRIGGSERQLWVSTSEVSLIGVKENRKRPMLSMNSYVVHPKEELIISDATQYYILSELDVVVDVSAHQNQEYDKTLKDLNLLTGEKKSFSEDGYEVYRTITKLNIPVALPGVDIPEGEVYLFNDFGFSYLISSNKETLKAIVKNRITCIKNKKGRKRQRLF